MRESGVVVEDMTRSADKQFSFIDPVESESPAVVAETSKDDDSDYDSDGSDSSSNSVVDGVNMLDQIFNLQNAENRKNLGLDKS